MGRDRYCRDDCFYLVKKEIGYYCKRYKVYLKSWVSPIVENKTVFSFYKCMKGRG